MTEATLTEVPTRDQIAVEDTWDLTTIYATGDDWEAELAAVGPATERAASYRGRLGDLNPKAMGLTRKETAQLDKLLFEVETGEFKASNEKKAPVRP